MPVSRRALVRQLLAPGRDEGGFEAGRAVDHRELGPPPSPRWWRGGMPAGAPRSGRTRPRLPVAQSSRGRQPRSWREPPGGCSRWSGRGPFARRTRRQPVSTTFETRARVPSDLYRRATARPSLVTSIDRARRDTVDAGLPDRRDERLPCRPARFEEAGEAAALARLRGFQRNPPGAGIPVSLAIPVSPGFPHRRARPLGCARPCLDPGFHDPLRREGQLLTHEIAISLLRNELDQSQSVAGPRHLRLRVQLSPPEPSPKIDGDRQRRLPRRPRLPEPPAGGLSWCRKPRRRLGAQNMQKGPCGPEGLPLRTAPKGD